MYTFIEYIEEIIHNVQNFVIGLGTHGCIFCEILSSGKLVMFFATVWMMIHIGVEKVSIEITNQKFQPLPKMSSMRCIIKNGPYN